MLVAYPIPFLSNRNLILCPGKIFISQPSLQIGVTKYSPMVCEWKVLIGLEENSLFVCLVVGYWQGRLKPYACMELECDSWSYSSNLVKSRLS